MTKLLIVADEPDAVIPTKVGIRKNELESFYKLDCNVWRHGADYELRQCSFH